MAMKQAWLNLRLWQQSFFLKKSHIKEYHHQVSQQCRNTFEKAQLVAIDLEMTGLDPETDQIISIGLIPIENGQIPLNKAAHKMVRITGSVGQSAAIHGIVDNHLDAAMSLQQALDWFLQQTLGKVIIAHHAPLDLQFLKAKLKLVYGESPSFCYIDTMQLEKTRWLRQHEVLKEGCLRLGTARQRYHLPVYSAHSALIDALACAELLLAQLSAMGALTNTKMIELVERQ
ncbi:exonuclease domain-containing protein [Shewanella maritima]|uniref:exonuclease domain-containing protein n=1 Tax=Shewanella maritima TaxID=2520507 RepID=UPI0037355FAF